MNSILLLDSEIKSASYVVEAGQSFALRLASFNAISSCKIEVFVKKDATFEGVFADFSTNDAKANVLVHLDEEGASATFRLASISRLEQKKTFDISILHHNKNTSGLAESYGICKDASRLVFTGVSSIDKYARGSNTRQSAKIIVFDSGCLGRCTPILKIDENDVRASHAAVVGKLNEDHLFYLQSRGLSLAEARKLITEGYLLPIAKYFDEKEVARIEEAIRENL